MVSKIWTVRTATHAPKLLTEVKEYTDLEEETPPITPADAGEGVFPLCASCVVHILTAADDKLFILHPDYIRVLILITDAQRR